MVNERSLIKTVLINSLNNEVGKWYNQCYHQNVCRYGVFFEVVVSPNCLDTQSLFGFHCLGVWFNSMVKSNFPSSHLAHISDNIGKRHTYHSDNNIHVLAIDVRVYSLLVISTCNLVLFVTRRWFWSKHNVIEGGFCRWQGYNCF